MKQLAPLNLPKLAIAEGATSPIPSAGVGAIAFSTTLDKIVVWVSSGCWSSGSSGSSGSSTPPSMIEASASTSSTVLDFSSSAIGVALALSANTTIDFINGYPGQRFLVHVYQPGGYTMSPGTSIKLSSDLPTIDIDTTANSRSYLGFIYNGDTYDYISSLKGFI
jgi:hypothetical protein